MRRFLHKILLFFGMLLIALGIFIGIVYLYSYKKVSNISLGNDIHTIICGDSHTKTALNDSIFPGALNIAHSSEHYLYTYNVLNILLKNNPQVKRVILGYSFHSLSSFYDGYLYDAEKTQYMYPRYFSVLDMNSVLLLFKENAGGLMGDFKIIYQSFLCNGSANKISEHPFIGEYYDSKRNNKNDSTILQALKTHYYNENRSFMGFSDFQQLYLEKIIDLCDSKDVQLVLINSPISKEYRAQVPEPFIIHYYDFAEKHKNLVLDYHDYIVPENQYGDGNHLNFYGALQFTKDFLKEECDSQEK